MQGRRDKSAARQVALLAFGLVPSSAQRGANVLPQARPAAAPAALLGLTDHHSAPSPSPSLIEALM